MELGTHNPTYLGILSLSLQSSADIGHIDGSLAHRKLLRFGSHIYYYILIVFFAFLVQRYDSRQYTDYNTVQYIMSWVFPAYHSIFFLYILLRARMCWLLICLAGLLSA